MKRQGQAYKTGGVTPAATGQKIALVNLITRTALVHHLVPAVASNRNAMIVAFARALQGLGVGVDLFVAEEYRPAQAEETGVNIFYLPSKWRKVFRPSCIPFTPALVGRLKGQYTTVVCSELFQASTVLAVIAKMTGGREIQLVVWQEMAAHQRMAGGLISKFYHSVLVKYWLDRHIDLYIPRGELAGRFLLSQGISSEKIAAVIPHGIDPARFYFDPASGKERYIFSPSRLVTAKGIDILLKAFAIVSTDIADLKLVIQGDGPGYAGYVRLAGELGIRAKVEFCTDHISHDAMRVKYQKALVTVIASRSDLVIFAAMESLACGTPVVISDGADSHKDFLDGRGGIVFPVNDHFALARALLHILNDAQFQKAMALFALSKAKKYSNDHLAKVFKQAITPGGA
jgi:1,2-diacylglycerol 3-alpha-glucosyltransferase